MEKTKRKSLGIIGGIIIVILLIVAFFISKYNKMVSLEEDVNNKYAIIDTQLQRKADLIPNLVNTVKGYAKHEEEIYTKVSEARSKLLSSNTVNETAEANEQLTTALTNMLLVVEKYPDLKANENFIGLQDELTGTENRISVARIDYNDSVADYNKSIKLFPNNIISSIFGFEYKEYFVADDDAKGDIDVSFE